MQAGPTNRMKLTPKAPGVTYNGSHNQFVSRNTMRFNPLTKTLVAAAVAGVASVGASTAFAQMAPQTADMTVTGTIVPASCSANFSGGAEVDLGTIRLIDLPDGAYYRIPGEKNIALNVNCNAGKRVIFSVADLQTTSAITTAGMTTALGSAAGTAQVFGFGNATVNGSPVPIGSYAIQMLAPTVDGTARTAIVSTNSGTSWAAAATATTAWLNKALTTTAYSAGTSGTAAVTNGQAFQFPLRIVAGLNMGSALQVSEDTKLNGQAIFAISYQ